ncbi:hypothetical protein DNTS_017881 [Danionella cerebrum]|uniref:RUN and SH3 domain-containing protein 1 n=1 Tax=Danionella cerebrum TaxID=2873325 RepID=A0A553N234_9TELE|nr:hypothetical protein DNTS_017881 [Danionella translucida]
MHPSTRPSVPPRTRRFDNRHVEAKPNQVAKREDKNLNAESSPLSRCTGGPPVSSRLKMPRQGARGPVVQSKTVQPQRNGAHAIPAVSKPKSLHPLSNLGQLEDPNCNEPSLPCLCCDGLSPQDNNSLFNHNHNNNNTVSIRHQMKIPPPPPPQKELHSPNQGNGEDESKPEIKHCNPVSLPIEDREEENGNIGGKKDEDPKNEDINVHVNGNVDVNGNGNCEIEEDGDDSDDEDDDTLVPSGCNCPESMLDSSLTSSTSSSSTSISSCSDLECDYPEAFSLSLQDQEAPEYDISSHSPVFQSNALPLDLNTSAGSPCSSDEGYPSAPWSPSSEYMECKVSEDRKSIKVDLLHFLDSIEDLGKVDLFYRIVKLARWELDGEMVVKDRLDHQQKLQIVNKEAKLAYFLKLQEEGLDLGREDITGLLDEMGNIDIHWKLYKSGKSSDSQEFFDAGVDLTAPSDLDESPAFDSLASSPVEPPSCPPKPPTRHASVQAEPHTYKNIDRHAFSALSINDNNTFSPSVLDPSHLAMPHSFSASRPPFLPPSPGQSVPYFTVNTDKPAPIPPPRRRHKARLEAQRLAELEKEKTPLSLPPPTSRPPPLPPPPLSSFTQAISPPQSLSSPPSFHALDVEIRKLLALAGLTQAELLKLSPELGVCVDVSLETEQQQPDALEIKEIWKNERCEGDIADKQLHYRLREGTRFGQDRQRVETVGEKGESNNGQREAQRTTTFTEMARRRKRNGGNFDYNCSCDFTPIVTQSPSSYYTTSFSHTNIPNLNFEYTSVISETPPPPPPRPLPPCPLKACTLSANASRPDRFDWLIAFTPDTESPPTIRQKASNEGILQKVSTGSKVTTFKELRNKSKQSSPPTLVQPEPDPTVITPDPDFLYNLKWRKEKSDGDGWEYISQAQASFLQPPPTPASLSLFREMCHLNTQEDYSGVHKISKHIDSTISESTHETLSGVDTEKLEDEDKTDVRGTADGAWTLESRTAGRKQENDLKSNMSCLYHQCYQADSFEDSFQSCSHDPEHEPIVYPVFHTETDSVRDSRYSRKNLTLFTDPVPQTDIDTLTDGDITPYKNIDMKAYIAMRKLQRYVNKNTNSVIEDSKPPVNPFFDQNSNETDNSLVSLPAYYLYNPTNCPLHKGAPPRMSPVGAITPPHRSGPPVPGTEVARLCSPLFPRSHTIPALAAPLYYPYLYTPPVQAPLGEPSLSTLHSLQTPPPLTLTVCSFEQTHAAWIREDVRPSLNTEGLSSACLEEKRALVSSALSGNSRVNPSLARLVLQCLCPALRSLLCDGLKPHQSDLIAGRRPNSPWGLVQASTKPGPSTQALHSLQSKVAGLSQLKQRRHKFNAFVFGLLNIKLLDYWLSHLLSCADVLGTFYHPTSFMRLSLTCFQPLFEELVLVLQPLSLLTFNLDLLFQHHHLDPSSPALTPASHKFESCSPQDEDPSLHLQTKGLLCGKSHLLGSIHGGWGFDSNPEADLTSQILDVSAYRNPISMSREASPAASWFRENEIPEVAHTESFSQQAGYALQQGWGAVIRFGERLGQNFGLAVGTDDNKSRNTPVDFTTRSPIQNRQQSRQELSLRESGATIPWGLGRLFGASVSSNSLSTNRRPSQWLSPGVSALSRIVNLSQGSQKTDLQQNKKENEQMNETRDQRMPLRAVRALCDHTGTGAELSFRKGEELVLVGGVDHNWIRCRRGHNEGLVPIGYASLIM